MCATTSASPNSATPSRPYSGAPSPPSAAPFLTEAADLIDGERNHTYGTPTTNFANIADYWTIQFGHLLKDGARFTAGHVAQAQALTKLARMIAQPKRDNWVDLAGYAGCGAECDEVAAGLVRGA